MCLPFSVGNVAKFPRMNVWDPYKRLGISPYASEEEIWGSRNFLLQQYSGHERSEESIEAAFEKLLMTSFKERKKTKINLKTRLKKKVEESPPWVKNLLNFVELPPVEVIFRRLFLFAFMGGWSIMNSAEGGPAFQVCSMFPVLAVIISSITVNHLLLRHLLFIMQQQLKDNVVFNFNPLPEASPFQFSHVEVLLQVLISI